MKLPPRTIQLAKRLWGDAFDVVENTTPWGSPGNPSPYRVWRPQQGEVLYVPNTIALARDEAVKRARSDLERHLIDTGSKVGPGSRAWDRALAERVAPVNEDFRQRAIRAGARNPPKQFETGRPFIAQVFHGSGSPHIEHFDDAMLGSNTGANSARLAHFMAGGPENAGRYAGMPNDYRGDSAREWMADMPRWMDNFPRLDRHADYADEPLQKLAEEMDRVPGFAARWGHEPRSQDEVEQLLLRLGRESRTRPSLPKRPSVYRLVLKSDNPLVHDFKGAQYRETHFSDLLNDAEAGGHDAVVMANSRDPLLDNIFAAFDPTKLRSIYARFGRHNLRSANLTGAADPRLLGILAGGTGAAAYGGAFDEIDALLDEITGGN